MGNEVGRQALLVKACLCTAKEPIAQPFTAVCIFPRVFVQQMVPCCKWATSSTSRRMRAVAWSQARWGLESGPVPGGAGKQLHLDPPCLYWLGVGREGRHQIVTILRAAGKHCRAFFNISMSSLPDLSIVQNLRLMIRLLLALWRSKCWNSLVIARGLSVGA